MTYAVVTMKNGKEFRSDNDTWNPAAREEMLEFIQQKIGAYDPWQITLKTPEGTDVVLNGLDVSIVEIMED